MSSTNCRPIGHTNVLSINGMLHITILFIFLSILFVFIISKLARSAINDEIIHSVKNELLPVLKGLKPDQKEKLKKLPLEKIQKAYSKENDIIKTNNDWLFNIIIIMNVVLFVFCVGFIITLHYNCDKCVPITEILIENAIIFTCVGIIEYVFFMNIAFKFIPTAPSYLVSNLKSSMQNEIDLALI